MKFTIPSMYTKTDWDGEIQAFSPLTKGQKDHKAEHRELLRNYTGLLEIFVLVVFRV